ncbi:DUF4190 domain-containing protein [Arthrobacter sp. JCM 19049]|uniref:DUF4190 domain-containing protein n=1 Tax=Arthrobacter sp. JCM 19049 TaxID=1460643 RepID=UPI0006CF6D9C|nr:DUF4190 domain-containing protein [Arthrobacter sp. JCM 19049]
MSTPSNEPTNPYSQGAPSYDSGSFNQPPQFHGQTPGGTQQPQQYNSREQLTGGQLAQTSMILGILALVFSALGIILGPIAISKANKAERQYNTAATVGRVTGWLGTFLGALWVLAGLLVLFGMVSFYSNS